MHNVVNQGLFGIDQVVYDVLHNTGRGYSSKLCRLMCSARCFLARS